MKSLLPLIIASALTFATPSVFSQDAAKFQQASITATNSDSLTIVHASGTTEVKTNPQRVVLFDFGTYDSLLQLGLNERVVALPGANVPDYLKQHVPANMADAGGMKTPDVALITSLKPDLIIITGRQGASYDALSAIAPTLNLSINGKDYLSSLKGNLEILGQIFGVTDAVGKEWEKLLVQVKQSQTQIEQAGIRSLALMHNNGKLLPAHQAIIFDVLKAKKLAFPAAEKGAENKRKAVTPAEIAQLSPGAIFIIDRSAAIGAEKMDLKAFEEDQNIKSTPASQHKRIAYLTPDLWYLSGGGLQSLALQIQAITHVLGKK